MMCHHCGRTLDPSCHFCPNCGQPLRPLERSSFGIGAAGAAAAPAREPMAVSEGPPIEGPPDIEARPREIVHRAPVATAYVIAIIALVFVAVIITIAAFSLRPLRAPSAAGESARVQAMTAHQAQTNASGMPLQQPYHQAGAGLSPMVALYPGAQPVAGLPDFYTTTDKAEQVEAFYRAVYPDAHVSVMPGRTAIAVRAAFGEVRIEIATVPAGTEVWIQRP